MIMTNEIIEKYKIDPYKFSYDSGYNCASIDAWNEYNTFIPPAKASGLFYLLYGVRKR